MRPISVLMCVWNREKYLSEAINSILNQTFSDFEFIIVLDGTTGRPLEIVNSYAKNDPRIKVVINEQNMGITRSTARGLGECSGKYTAMMDSDDISLPNRLQVQYDYLESHPEMDVLGSGLDFIDEEGNRTGKFLVRPADPLVIRYQMLYHCVLHNPSVLGKTTCLRKFNDDHAEETYDSAQDYAFWMRINFDHFFSNLPDRLLLYRLHSHQQTNTAFSQQRESELTAAQRSFESLLGRSIPKETVKGFHFSERYVETDPVIVRQGIGIMFQAHKTFEKTQKLTSDQRYEIRKFAYEKIKSFMMKYRQMPGVLRIGILGLVQLSPEYFLRDSLSRFKKIQAT
jgi:glycosyltransferase involved in cell wall biosynthesis